MSYRTLVSGCGIGGWSSTEGGAWGVAHKWVGHSWVSCSFSVLYNPTLLDLSTSTS